MYVCMYGRTKSGYILHICYGGVENAGVGKAGVENAGAITDGKS